MNARRCLCLRSIPWTNIYCSMEPLGIHGTWTLALSLLLYLHVGCSENATHASPRVEHELLPFVKTVTSGCHNQTSAVYSMCQHLQSPSFVWTDSLTEGRFNNFRFGISLNVATHGIKTVREAVASHVHVGVKEQVLVTVAAETNQSDTTLIISACELESKLHVTRTYFMRDGCLDNRTAEEIWKWDKMRVFSLHLSSLPLVPGSSVVFVTCDVKLCLSSNQSQACSSGCPLVPSIHTSLLETQHHKVTAELIYVVQKSKRVVATNYAALVIGLVLGATVVAVVVLLVRKSFAGVRRRNASVEL